MNRRNLLTSALASLGAALMPWRKKREEVAVYELWPPRPGPWPTSYYLGRDKMHNCAPMFRCQLRPECEAPAGSLCGLCPVSLGRSSVVVYEPEAMPVPLLQAAEDFDVWPLEIEP